MQRPWGRKWVGESEKKKKEETKVVGVWRARWWFREQDVRVERKQVRSSGLLGQVREFRIYSRLLGKPRKA